jgi:hypothetical protein
MWRRRQAFAAFTGLAVALAAVSCSPSPEAVADGDDPLRALTAPAQSARYDGPFWTREAHRNTRTWQAAKAVCQGHRELPNCHAVELVLRWEQPFVLPPLPPPPPLPPATHTGEAGYQGADVVALKAWEAQLRAAQAARTRKGGPR